MGLFNEIYMDYHLPVPAHIKFKIPLQTSDNRTVKIQTKDLLDYRSKTYVMYEVDEDGYMSPLSEESPSAEEIDAYLIWEGQYLQWRIWFINNKIEDVSFIEHIDLLRSREHDLVV